jgi:hypothetical protein
VCVEGEAAVLLSSIKLWACTAMLLQLRACPLAERDAAVLQYSGA